MWGSQRGDSCVPGTRDELFQMKMDEVSEEDVEVQEVEEGGKQQWAKT